MEKACSYKEEFSFVKFNKFKIKSNISSNKLEYFLVVSIGGISFKRLIVFTSVNNATKNSEGFVIPYNLEFDIPLAYSNNSLKC